ncbi:MAG: phospho-N-acetylmuramoyl-pentapeptide-transferase [Planctomycetota bacterium]
MLGWLAELEQTFGIGPLRLFGYISSRVVFAALTAYLLMMIVMPPLIRLLRRLKFGEQGGKNEGAVVVDAMRERKAGTPTMGGVGLIGSVAVAAVLWCDPLQHYTWIMLTALLGFGAIGFIDDRTKIVAGAGGLSKRGKLTLQLGLGLGLGLWILAVDHAQVWVLRDAVLPGQRPWEFAQTLSAHITLPLIPVEAAIPLGFGLVVWVVVMTFACSNSVNFTDGLDGLAAGTMLIAVLAFMVIAYLTSRVDAAAYLRIFYVPGAQEVAVFCAAVAGACLGFLWFNAAPAEIFMGDTGSQALGGALAVIATCVKQEFLLLLVGFVFFLEGASVAIQVASYRLRGGKRVFLCAPIHHHFQYLGWPETRIVTRFWIMAALATLVALASLKLR